ncbi:hypothetical protein ACFCYB_00250 [Streptomyces sp. NPDC056309]|uniref:hypothetical protein n=1 Tax=Streptomyces sp. NPDC056309 TaxID=3345781 RepID=UPI0035DDAE67
MDRKATPAPPEPPGSPHGEPSHVRSVLDVMAHELERLSNRRRLLTEVGLRRAFTAAIGTVPTEVADEVGDRVTALLPDTGPVITHGGYATLLREIAQGTPNTPADDENASAAELHDRANADYSRARARRSRLSHEDRLHGNAPEGGH